MPGRRQPVESSVPAPSTGSQGSTGQTRQQKAEGSSEKYFTVSPLLLVPRTTAGFKVFLKNDSGYVLYANGAEGFTEEHQRRLFNSGVKEVHILGQERKDYVNYIEQNLGRVLDNESFNLRERAEILYNVSVTALEEAFEQKLPSALGPRQHRWIISLVRTCVGFLGKNGSMKRLARLIRHDYNTYSHCMNVFLLATATLQTYGLDQEKLQKWGAGAILHDLGKTRIPRSILRKPGKLDPDERAVVETHPVQGAALCAKLSLGQEALNAILFHHEKMDGSGYPAGMNGFDIPLPVRVVVVTDIYDALTTDRPYAKQRSPFEALTLMREEMDGQLDMEVFKRLVQVLSGARIV
jgi:putative nucleotidyltransferase with HDIG domain